MEENQENFLFALNYIDAIISSHDYFTAFTNNFLFY